jgi:hypothetical protein
VSSSDAWATMSVARSRSRPIAATLAAITACQDGVIVLRLNPNWPEQPPPGIFELESLRTSLVTANWWRARVVTFGFIVSRKV